MYINNFTNLNLSNTESMKSMFEGCSSLEENYILSHFLRMLIPNYYFKIFMMYLYDFNPKKVIYSDDMFKDCIALKNINISY